MRNFSIIQDCECSALNQYIGYLKNEVYSGTWSGLTSRIDSPLFLQQLSVIEADSIRKAIQLNAAITYDIGSKTNEKIELASQWMSDQMRQLSADVTSSLETGFSMLNASLCGIDSDVKKISMKIDDANRNLYSIARISEVGFNMVNQHLVSIDQNIKAINNNVGMVYSGLRLMTLSITKYLDSILNEIKLPETQRAIRFHTENGLRYLSHAMKYGSDSYFEDALDEFRQSISINGKDYVTWFYLAYIYSHSLKFLDIDKALVAYDKFFHYAYAAPSDSPAVKEMVEDAHFNVAELYYIQGRPERAASEVMRCCKKIIMSDFYRAKYLSCISDDAERQKAADIIYKLLHDNPFMAMRILEDYDLLRNKYVSGAIRRVKEEVYDYVAKRYEKIADYVPDADNKENEAIKLIDSVRSLLEKGTLIDYCQAMSVINTKLKVRIASNCSFELSLEDYVLLEDEFELMKNSQFEWSYYYDHKPVGLSKYIEYHRPNFEKMSDRIKAISHIPFDFKKGDMPLVLKCLSMIASEFRNDVLSNNANQVVGGNSYEWLESYYKSIVEQLQFLGEDEISEVFDEIDNVISSLDGYDAVQLHSLAYVLYSYVDKSKEKDKNLYVQQQSEKNWLQKLFDDSTGPAPKRLYDILLGYAHKYGGEEMRAKYQQQEDEKAIREQKQKERDKVVERNSRIESFKSFCQCAITVVFILALFVGAFSLLRSCCLSLF